MSPSPSSACARPSPPRSARQERPDRQPEGGLDASAKRVSPHTLRHSFATHLLERKTDIRVILVLLGHRKLDTTALDTRVALKTMQAVESPLAHLRPKAPPPAWRSPTSWTGTAPTICAATPGI